MLCELWNDNLNFCFNLLVMGIFLFVEEKLDVMASFALDTLMFCGGDGVGERLSFWYSGYKSHLLSILDRNLT